MSSSVFVMLWREENKEKFRQEFMRRHCKQDHPNESPADHDMMWVDASPAEKEEYNYRSFWSIPCHWDEEHNLDTMVLAAQVLHDLGIWGDIQPSPGSDVELPRELQ